MPMTKGRTEESEAMVERSVISHHRVLCCCSAARAEEKSSKTETVVTPGKRLVLSSEKR